MLKTLLSVSGGHVLFVARCFSGEVICGVNKLAGLSPPLSTEASLYVHWPYCLRRCSYCNFNKYIPRSDNQDVMSECLQRETETLLRLSQVSRVTSVFFGGGTPSLARPSTIAAILETVARHVALSEDAEITLEVNPTPIGSSKLQDFFHAGVNRFSIGVQSLCDEDLKVLGRDHNSKHAVETVAEARGLCPGKVSVDIMFGRPSQGVASWELELEELLSLCDDHISLYQLTLERGTQLFSQVQTRQLSMPSDDITALMYETARKILQKRSYIQYEVSNFARNGAISQHNMSYWNSSQYIGVGPGAHGRFTPHGEGVCREARTQTLEPDVWVREVQLRGHGTRRRIPLGHLGLLEEVLVMGLRLIDGITHQHWQLFSPGADLHHILTSSAEFRDLQQKELLILDNRGLRCSWKGLAYLDCLLPTLLLQLESHINQEQEQARNTPRETTL
ncbi:hypothetical protein UPYG_G00109590 [Umbra pygmaea]|uniref:Radical S-adenosyl methionine domain-containing protein n=1 Tax=Umbra pygmaea TaxID=75934 RepID=A0ABD0XSA1_UMBPY